MKKADGISILVALFVLCAFAFVPGVAEAFSTLSRNHGYAMSFVKFAVLATFGECLALRIVTGAYNRRGFGILPRFLVWGLLGVCIKVAFTIFAVGTPALLAQAGLDVSAKTLATGPLGLKVLAAFSVSLAVNCVFSPWMMTAHKLTDTHIQDTGGTLSGFLTIPDLGGLLARLDWSVLWGFVFKKTIPLFWIPAHTITFMLPGEFQILFAATLGIMLGLILALAANRPAPASQTVPS